MSGRSARMPYTCKTLMAAAGPRRPVNRKLIIALAVIVPIAAFAVLAAIGDAMGPPIRAGTATAYLHEAGQIEADASGARENIREFEAEDLPIGLSQEDAQSIVGAMERSLAVQDRVVDTLRAAAEDGIITPEESDARAGALLDLEASRVNIVVAVCDTQSFVDLELTRDNMSEEDCAAARAAAAEYGDRGAAP